MNENQPKKPQFEREITYRIGRRTGKIQMQHEVGNGVVSDKGSSSGKASISTNPIATEKRSELVATYLRKAIWSEAPQPKAIVLRIGLFAFPFICLALVLCLVNTLSNLNN